MGFRPVAADKPGFRFSGDRRGAGLNNLLRNLERVTNLNQNVADFTRSQCVKRLENRRCVVFYDFGAGRERRWVNIPLACGDRLALRRQVPPSERFLRSAN